VRAQNSAGHKFTVAVGKSGRFALWLPAGLCRLTGRGPMFPVNGVEGMRAGPTCARQGREDDTGCSSGLSAFLMTVPLTGVRASYANLTRQGFMGA
jgi:hypothetical protein